MRSARGFVAMGLVVLLAACTGTQPEVAESVVEGRTAPATEAPPSTEPPAPEATGEATAEAGTENRDDLVETIPLHV